MAETTQPNKELLPEERARRIKASKEQTSPLIKEFFHNIGDSKKLDEILEKVKNLEPNLGPNQEK